MPRSPDLHASTEVLGRSAGAVLTALPAAACWAFASRSPWVAAMTLALGAVPFAWSPVRVHPAVRVGLAFLAGGTAAAIALLTGHARVP